jgi:transcriptional regulator with XRE-family HTH domain
METEKRITIEAAGRAVAANIAAIRDVNRMTKKELTARLTAAGRPLERMAIHRIENLGRRVDADDLVAFANVFGIEPAELLKPMATLPMIPRVGDTA